jgi:hypothetical protein
MAREILVVTRRRGSTLTWGPPAHEGSPPPQTGGQVTSNFTTFAEDTSVGTIDWLNDSNAQTSNNTYAVVGDTVAYAEGSDITSYYLVATQLATPIPSDATVTGITIYIERKASKNTGGVFVDDNRVRLVKGGTIQATDKASASVWPTTDTATSYGGSSDLWSDTWSASDINASNFGVALSVNSWGDNIELETAQASVDHIYAVIDYTVPAASRRRIPAVSFM